MHSLLKLERLSLKAIGFTVSTFAAIEPIAIDEPAVAIVRSKSQSLVPVCEPYIVGQLFTSKLNDDNGLVWKRRILRVVGFKIATKTPVENFAHLFSVQIELNRNLKTIAEDLINNFKISLKLFK